ncbi:MAG: hypothetical protein E2590_03695 [Chryseobacterium sp.]|nr:hypothetical protein [Chryseobacterium sp.]
MLETKPNHKRESIPILLGKMFFCVVMLLGQSLKVYAAANTTDSTGVEVPGQEIFVSGNAYIYGLDHDAKIKVVYSERKGNIRKSKASCRSRYVRRDMPKKIRQSPEIFTEKKITNDHSDGSVFFSTSNAGAIAFSPPSDHFQTASFITIERNRTQIFKDIKVKLPCYMISFHKYCRKFRFSRPPPVDRVFTLALQ